MPGLKTTFVGHPLVDELEEKRIPGVARDELLVGLFPGSREREIARLFPMMIETAKLLRSRRGDLKFEVPAASAKLAAQIRELMAAAGAGDLITVNSGESHSLMQRACCAVIASGTATLEAAYYGLPYCLVYRVAPLTYAAAKVLVKIKLHRHRQHPRRRGSGGGIDPIRRPAGQGFRITVGVSGMPGKTRRRSKRAWRKPRSKLGGPGAHERAAKAVAGWLTGSDPE